MFELLGSFEKASLEEINKIKKESFKKFPKEPVERPVDAVVVVGKKTYLIKSDKIIPQIQLMSAEWELLWQNLIDNEEKPDYFRRRYAFLYAVTSVLVEYELINRQGASAE